MRLRGSGWLVRLVTAVVLGAGPSGAMAQSGPRPFVEAGLGVAHGVGGTYAKRDKGTLLVSTQLGVSLRFW